MLDNDDAVLECFERYRSATFGAQAGVIEIHYQIPARKRRSREPPRQSAQPDRIAARSFIHDRAAAQSKRAHSLQDLARVALLPGRLVVEGVPGVVP